MYLVLDAYKRKYPDRKGPFDYISNPTIDYTKEFVIFTPFSFFNFFLNAFFIISYAPVRAACVLFFSEFGDARCFSEVLVTFSTPPAELKRTGSNNLFLNLIT